MSLPSAAELASLCDDIYSTIAGTGFEHFDIGGKTASARIDFVLHRAANIHPRTP
jgi:hypothetical protein